MSEEQQHGGQCGWSTVGDMGVTGMAHRDNGGRSPGTSQAFTLKQKVLPQVWLDLKKKNYLVVEEPVHPACKGAGVGLGSPVWELL